jgi:hypothetical protein
MRIWKLKVILITCVSIAILFMPSGTVNAMTAHGWFVGEYYGFPFHWMVLGGVYHQPATSIVYADQFFFWSELSLDLSLLMVIILLINLIVNGRRK